MKKIVGLWAERGLHRQRRASSVKVKQSTTNQQPKKEQCVQCVSLVVASALGSWLLVSTSNEAMLIDSSNSSEGTIGRCGSLFFDGWIS